MIKVVLIVFNTVRIFSSWLILGRAQLLLLLCLFLVAVT